MRKTKNVIFELSRPGRVGYSLPKSDVPKTDFKAKLPEHLVRKQPAELPEISELQLMRHYTNLSQDNFRRGKRLLSAGFLHNEIQSENQ